MRDVLPLIMLSALLPGLFACGDRPQPAPDQAGPAALTSGGLQAEYFGRVDLSGAAIRRTDPVIDFDWGTGAPAPGLPADNFSARWTGRVTAPSDGLYTFTATADDGVRLWVNGVKLIDQWFDQPPTAHSGSLRLKAGQAYAIKLEYYESGGLASVQLAWRRDRQGAAEVVPAATLGPEGGLAAGLPETAPLRELAEARGLLIGAALNLGPLNDEPLYAQTAAREFNLTPPEGASMIAAPTHRAEAPHGLNLDAQGRLQPLDGIVDFSTANGQQSQSFHLFWYLEGVWAPWLTGLELPQKREFMANRARDLLTRYQGRIQTWNVVNEALEDDGTLRPEQFDFEGQRYRNWLYALGPDYVADAFWLARSVDGGAKLYYNEYGAEGDGLKWDGLLKMMRDFKARGVPIDGVGFQMHLELPDGFRPDQLRRHMRELEALGLETRITELDVGVEKLSASPEERRQRQAEVYKQAMQVCLEAPNCTALNMWGFTDKHSWVADGGRDANAPLPFDVNYQPKPAYFALRDALLGR